MFFKQRIIWKCRQKWIPLRFWSYRRMALRRQQNGGSLTPWLRIFLWCSKKSIPSGKTCNLFESCVDINDLIWSVMSTCRVNNIFFCRPNEIHLEIPIPFAQVFSQYISGGWVALDWNQLQFYSGNFPRELKKNLEEFCTRMSDVWCWKTWLFCSAPCQTSTEFPIGGALYFLLKPVVHYCRRSNPLERPPATEVAAWQKWSYQIWSNHPMMW